MDYQKKITTTADEMACFMATLIGVIYENRGRRLNYNELKEIHKKLCYDISNTNFKKEKRDFEELLFIYQVAAESDEEDLQEYLNTISEIFGNKNELR